jgi:hypothetical protein
MMLWSEMVLIVGMNIIINTIIIPMRDHDRDDNDDTERMLFLVGHQTPRLVGDPPIR